MSSRNYLIAAPTLLLAALCGIASPVVAGETKPFVPETCEATTRASSAGHPGKSALFPKQEQRSCARPKRARLILASFTDAPGGKALVGGRTEIAIQQIYAKQTAPTRAATLNNLCVAHTVLRQWEEARDACDAAVASAVAARADRSYSPRMTRLLKNAGASVAYSNRAVMHLLARDVLAAQNDLASARAISPKARYVMRNSDVAQRAPALAQALDTVTLQPIG